MKSTNESNTQDPQGQPTKPAIASRQEREANKASKETMKRLRAARADYVNGQHTGDDLAFCLADQPIETIARVGEAVLGETAESLIERYDHLNAGQQSMNIRNRIRARIKKEPGLMEVVYPITGKPEILE